MHTRPDTEWRGPMFDPVVEFTNEEIERLQKEIAAKHGYELIDHNLVLYVRPLNKGDDK